MSSVSRVFRYRCPRKPQKGKYLVEEQEWDLAESKMKPEVHQYPLTHRQVQAWFGRPPSHFGPCRAVWFRDAEAPLQPWLDKTWVGCVAEARLLDQPHEEDYACVQQLRNPTERNVETRPQPEVRSKTLVLDPRLATLEK